MLYPVAEVIREVRSNAINNFGNTYISYDETRTPLDREFQAMIETRTYKEYTRRLLKTMDDVSYLRPNYFVANKQTPDKLMAIWEIDDDFTQNERISTTIFLTNADNGPAA